MATILTKKSDTASAVPVAGDLTNSSGGAELAVNTADKRLFAKNSGGTVVEIGTNPTSITTGTATATTVNSTTVDTTNLEVTNIKAKDGTAAGSIADSTGVVTLASSVLTTTDINGGTIDNTAIGGATPATGAFTTLSASSTVTLSGGTANGVAYLDGSKVLTTGSALTFDGSRIALGTATSNIQLTTTVNTNQAYISLADADGRTAVFRGPNSGAPNCAQIGTVTNHDTAFLYGNTEQMRLTSTGLGIGTSSPATIVHIQKASGNTYYRAQNNLANVDFGVDSAGTGILWNNSNYPLAFGTNNTERMRIDSSGNLLIGTTTAISSSRLTLGGALGGGTAAEINNSDSGSWIPMRFHTASTLVGYISSNTTTTSYNTSSDYRLKNITGPITNSGAYIDSLNPVEGTWKADGSTFVGLIAHEVQEASRTTVATGVKDGEEMQGMDYSSAEIIANLIAEVKSLRQRLAAAGI